MSLEPQTLPVCLFPKKPWISTSKLGPKLCFIYYLQYAICATNVTCPFNNLLLCVTPLIKSGLEPGRCSQWIDSPLPALWDTSLTQSSFLWKWALKSAPKIFYSERWISCTIAKRTQCLINRAYWYWTHYCSSCRFDSQVSLKCLLKGWISYSYWSPSFQSESEFCTSEVSLGGQVASSDALGTAGNHGTAEIWPI